MQTLSQLLQRLKSEDDGSYVYRGQLREYPGPLVSSAYRSLVYKHRSHEGRELPRTLRGVQPTVLVQRVLTGHSADRESALDYQRRQIRQAIRGFFGYALTEVLCQQAGLCSESLDVTTSPEIAAFFAAYEWVRTPNDPPRYSPFRPSSNDQGVVYRWRIRRPALSMEALKSWTYFHCPPFLDSCAVLKLFQGCETLADSLRAFKVFRDSFRDPEYGDCLMPKLGANRALELLRLPFETQLRSRIVAQKAALMIPDCLENDSLWKAGFPDYPRPEHGAWDGPPMIEDFSRSRGVDVFRFAHQPDQCACISVSADAIAGNGDIELALTSGWIRSLMSNPCGVIPIRVTQDVDFGSIDLFSPSGMDAEMILINGQLVGRAATVVKETEKLTEEIAASTNGGISDAQMNGTLKAAQSCSENRTWETGVRLLACLRERLSVTRQLRAYLWCSDQLSRMLQKQGRVTEAHAILADLLAMCEDRLALQPSRESRQHVVIAHDLIFALLRDAEMVTELLMAYRKFIERFGGEVDREVALRIAHARHALAEELDGQREHAQALEQYTAVLTTVRAMDDGDEEISGLIATASFSRANCLERLGQAERALREFDSFVQEFARSKSPRCRHAAQLAATRAQVIRARLT